MNKQILAFALLLTSVMIFSCGEPKFKKLKSGIEYKILKKGKGGKKVTLGSMVSMHVKTLLKDSVLFDTYKANNQEPVQAKIMKPMHNGDIMDALVELSEGDSAVIKIQVDSLFQGGQLPEFVKKGDLMNFTVKILSVKSEEEFNKAQEAAAGAQNGIDDKLIQDYLAQKNLKAQKSPEGIYYIIEKTGNGKHPSSADEVKVHYTGTLLDGTKFDSSLDGGQPLEISLAKVIRGWTQGIPLFDEGGKGKLIIPSSLAYGPNPQPGSPIKPNSVLVFDIELLQIMPSK